MSSHLPQLQDLSVIELLKLKRQLGDVTNAVIDRIQARLTALVASRMEIPGIQIVWEDAVLSTYHTSDVIVSGIRMLVDGDIVQDEDGNDVTIDVDTMNVLAQRVMILIPESAVPLLEDPNVPITKVMEVIDATLRSQQVESLGDLLDEAMAAVVEEIKAKEKQPESQDPVTTEPTSGWLYNQHIKSKTLH